MCHTQRMRVPVQGACIAAAGRRRRQQVSVQGAGATADRSHHRYEVRVQDSNGEWSDVEKGTVQRV